MRSQQEIVAYLRKVALNMHRNTEPAENQAATLIEQQSRRIAELEGALSACMPYMKYPRTEPDALVKVHKKAIERARAALAAAPTAVQEPLSAGDRAALGWDDSLVDRPGLLRQIEIELMDAIEREHCRTSCFKVLEWVRAKMDATAKDAQ